MTRLRVDRGCPEQPASAITQGYRPSVSVTTSSRRRPRRTGRRAGRAERAAALAATASSTAPRFLASVLAALLAVQVVFFAALVAAQAVPDAPIVTALATAVDDGTYGPAYVDDGVGGRADRFTECVIVGYGVTDPDDRRNVLQRAAWGPRLESCELGAAQITRLARGEGVGADAPYYRYWSGYSVLTRPVLALWGLTGLRLVSAGLLALAGLAAFAAVRRGAGTGPR